MVEERNRPEFRFVSTGFPDKTGIGHIVDSDVVPGICVSGNVNRKAPAPKVFLYGNSVNRQWIWQTLFKWNDRGHFYHGWLRIAVSFLNNNTLFKMAIAVWSWWVVFLHQIAIGKDFCFKTMLFHPELNELRFIHSPGMFQIKSEFGEGNGRT